QVDEPREQPPVPPDTSAPRPAAPAAGVGVTSGAQAGPLTPEQRCDAFFAGAVWMAGGSGAAPLARPDARGARPQGVDAGAVVVLGLVAGACWNAPRGESGPREQRGEGPPPLSLRPDASEA